jgi:hypothetical protein
MKAASLAIIASVKLIWFESHIPHNFWRARYRLHQRRFQPKSGLTIGVSELTNCSHFQPNRLNTSATLQPCNPRLQG